MDTTEVHTLLEDLGGDIDDLEASLEPLLKASLSTTTSRLPLLDKAKLYVLTTYAVESILFSYLRLNGVDAKEHAIFRELTRVKEYFDKIKTVEAGPEQRSTILDKDAASRFVTQGLAGNERYDQERRTREQRFVKRKADELEPTAQWGSHNRFESTAKRMRVQETMIPVIKASEADVESDTETKPNPLVLSKEEKKAAKRQRRIDAKLAKQSPVANSPQAHDDQATQHDVSRTVGPRSTHETFQSLLQGPIVEAAHATKKKSKRKSREKIQQELEDKRAREML